MAERVNRRSFVSTAAMAGVGATVAGKVAIAASNDKPALLGGTPVRTQAFPRWPTMDQLDEKMVLEVLRSGHWFRGAQDDKFEQAYARLLGAKHCVATSSGTAALVAALGALGIGPGDEVIVTPYTFIASITSIMMHHALPVLVDLDPESFEIDAGKIEAAISERTAAIMPVHIGGNMADMDAVPAIAKRHNLPVVEDACQAHLAQWRGRKAGTLGTVGCFSFQVTKNLSSGEGGAVLTDDDELTEKVYAFHNNCRGRKATSYTYGQGSGRAMNLRMTEFQGALLQAQMTRLEQNARRRDENAKYLTELLRDLPGVTPAKMYPGCTRNAWHLYMLRYNSDAFAGMPRSKFLQALSAEGIPASGGYMPFAWEEFIKGSFDTRGGRRVFPKDSWAKWHDRCAIPEYERLCGEAVWFTQTMLLGPRSDMEQIAHAIRRIHTHAAALAKA